MFLIYIYQDSIQKSVCYSNFNFINRVPKGVDIYWRDSILLTTLKENETLNKLVLVYSSTNSQHILSNFTIYGCLHGKLDESMCDIKINGLEKVPFVCSEDVLTSLKNMEITTNQTFEQIESGKYSENIEFDSI